MKSSIEIIGFHFKKRDQKGGNKMNEVLAKGKKRKKSLENLCKNTDQKRSTCCNCNQLISETAYILEENKRDIEEGKAKGFSDSLLDRLMLTENRIIDMTEGIKQLIELRDPVGECKCMGKAKWTIYSGNACTTWCCWDDLRGKTECNSGCCYYLFEDRKRSHITW